MCVRVGVGGWVGGWVNVIIDYRPHQVLSQYFTVHILRVHGWKYIRSLGKFNSVLYCVCGG